MGCCSSTKEENTRILYSCSGACDLGQVSDLLGRKLRKAGYAMESCSCLASISAGIRPYIEKARSAKEVVCLDGCGAACASKTLEKIDVQPKIYTLTKLGAPSGKFEVTEDIIEVLYSKIILDRDDQVKAINAFKDLVDKFPMLSKYNYHEPGAGQELVQLLATCGYCFAETEDIKRAQNGELRDLQDYLNCRVVKSGQCL